MGRRGRGRPRRPGPLDARAAAVLAACALAAGAGLASAGGPQARVSVEDRNDSTGAMDIAKARGSHNRVTDEIVFVLTAHDPFGPRRMTSPEGRPPGSVCLNLWTTHVPGEDAPNYEVCATPARDGKSFRASVARHRVAGQPLRRGPAKVEQPSSSQIDLRFDPDLIRRPRSFRWVAQSTSFGGGCLASTGCEDYTPDRPDSEELKLREPRRGG